MEKKTSEVAKYSIEMLESPKIMDTLSTTLLGLITLGTKKAV